MEVATFSFEFEVGSVSAFETLLGRSTFRSCHHLPDVVFGVAVVVLALITRKKVYF